MSFIRTCYKNHVVHVAALANSKYKIGDQKFRNKRTLINLLQFVEVHRIKEYTIIIL